MRSGAEPLRAIGSVFGPITRVRGVAGTPELVLGAVRSRLRPGAFIGPRTERGVSVEVLAEASSAPETARLVRVMRSGLEPEGSTRFPGALLMAAEVIGLAVRSTATLRSRASRDDAVIGVRSIRSPVRSTELKLLRGMLL